MRWYVVVVLGGVSTVVASGVAFLIGMRVGANVAYESCQKTQDILARLDGGDPASESDDDAERLEQTKRRLARELQARLIELDGDLSLGLAARDPTAAEKKIVCGTGVVSSIVRFDDGSAYTGLILTNDGVGIHFTTLADPGDTVAMSKVRFCGTVYGHAGPTLKAAVVLEPVE